MAKKMTAHRPSQANMEYVVTKDGRKVKNTAYVPSMSQKIPHTGMNAGSTPLPGAQSSTATMSALGERDLNARERALDAARKSTSREVRSWVKKFGGDDVYAYTPIDQLSTESLIDYTAGAFALKNDLASRGKDIPASVHEVVKACSSLPLSNFGVTSDGLDYRDIEPLDFDLIDNYSASVWQIDTPLPNSPLEKVRDLMETKDENGNVRNLDSVTLGQFIDLGREAEERANEYSLLQNDPDVSSSERDDYADAALLADDVQNNVHQWLAETLGQ